ncbi:hypothetical protein EYB26_002275 [Talaromyces marneffei]|uniref:uncharacterized protein n=1 Tax=Talaromyces marneffei TaxID=37727 RepID=UPI0012A9D7F5|nr:uncharacterized protein EYB26_002275 [Talaromyces marneffei]QGA14619.1 hypothetical protein EYB26_002275 [Talaromyces marneffei]
MAPVFSLESETSLRTHPIPPTPLSQLAVNPLLLPPHPILSTSTLISVLSNNESCFAHCNPNQIIPLATIINPKTVTENSASFRRTEFSIVFHPHSHRTSGLETIHPNHPYQSIWRSWRGISGFSRRLDRLQKGNPF